jgi:broad specificity phosphatase PhoE
MRYPSIQNFLSTIQGNCLVLARHGETDWNKLGILQGQQDRPLSALGYTQRKNLFFRLVDVQLVRIFTSKLQRTIQMAHPFCQDKGIEIKAKSSFNEAKLGIFEGENKSDFSDSFSKNIYKNFLNDEVNIALPGGGENLRMVYERIKTPLKEIVGSVKEGNTLMILHRNVNKMILKNLLGLTFEEGYQVEHKNDWLYIFFPSTRQVFSVKITTPKGEIEIVPGYEKIDKNFSAEA